VVTADPDVTGIRSPQASEPIGSTERPRGPRDRRPCCNRRTTDGV